MRATSACSTTCARSSGSRRTSPHSAVTATPKEQAIKTTEQVLTRLNIKPDQLDQLQAKSMQELIDVLRPPAGARAGGPGGGGLNFGPVLDGTSLPSNQFDPTAPAMSASVPFLTGTTATETTFFQPDARLHQIDEAELKTRVK